MAVDKTQYEISEYAERIRKALKHLEDTSQPGERRGKGGRMDVLQAAKADIERLAAMGYTAGQIADAIANGDVFRILPKSITQMLNAGKPKATGVAKDLHQVKAKIPKRTLKQNDTLDMQGSSTIPQFPQRKGIGSLSSSQRQDTPKTEPASSLPGSSMRSGPQRDRS